MAFLQGKSLQARRRIAVISTGCIAGVLLLLMIYLYVYPPKINRDPERGIVAGYTIIIEKVQSLFHRK